MNNEIPNVSELVFLGSCNDMWCNKDTCDCDNDCSTDSCNDCGCDDHRWGQIIFLERRCIIMQNEYVSELIMMNQMCCMDCSNEGSGDSDCDCDMVDGSQFLSVINEALLKTNEY